MMNKEKYNEIIDEVYDKYTTKYVGYDDVPSKELFLFEIRTNEEFSEKWGLKIEERELSLEERLAMVKQKNIQDIISDIPNAKKDEKYGQRYLDYCKIRCDIDNIPTKLITIKYNDETLESYE
jgi:hypothetical protein